LHSRMVPLVAVFSAFSFVVMMFNLPLPGGTTGHAVGVGSATIVTGPRASMLAISTADAPSLGRATGERSDHGALVANPREALPDDA